MPARPLIISLAARSSGSEVERNFPASRSMGPSRVTSTVSLAFEAMSGKSRLIRVPCAEAVSGRARLAMMASIRLTKNRVMVIPFMMSIVCDGVLGHAHLGAGDVQRGHELAARALAFGAAVLVDLMRGQTAE